MMVERILITELAFGVMDMHDSRFLIRRTMVDGYIVDRFYAGGVWPAMEMVIRADNGQVFNQWVSMQ